MKKYNKIVLGLLVLVIPVGVFCAQTKYINLQGATAFIKGDFENIQMDAQGKLLLSPSIEEVYDTKNLLIQTTLKVDNKVYFSTAKDAGLFVYDIDKKETTKIYENAQSLSIPSFVVKNNIIYFVESPSNTLYTLDLKEEEPTPQKIQTLDMASYVWQIGEYKDNLYLATGAKAALYKLSISNLSAKPEEVFHADEERHFITMSIKDNNCYLGGEGNGGVYRINLDDNKSELLFTAYEGEISHISVTDKDGIFVTTSNKEPKTIPTDFDYTDTILNQQLEYQMIKSHLMDAKQLNEDGSIKDTSKIGLAVKNSLYHIKEKTIDKLITLDNMSLNTMYLSDDESKFFIGTSNGRIFQYQIKENNLSLLASVDNEDITGIIPVDDKSALISTSNIGQLYLMGDTLASTGYFTSDIIDLGNKALLGHMNMDTDYPENGTIKASIRIGITQTVDKNWTDWISITPDMDLLELKDARYVQYKLEFNGKNGKTPAFIRILTPYLSSNRVPSISLFAAFYESSQDGSPKQNLQIRWSAVDPDKDQLYYRIYFKQRGDITWSLLTETPVPDKVTVDTRLFPDGVYQFKLEVSDELDNSPERSGKVEQISNFVLINNSAPVIEVKDSLIDGDNVKVTGTISNSVAIIGKAYYKLGLDSPQWKLIIPDNQIYDSKKINFTILLPKKELKSVENFLFIRAFDVNMNQVSVRVKLDKNGKKI